MNPMTRMKRKPCMQDQCSKESATIAASMDTKQLIARKEGRKATTRETINRREASMASASYVERWDIEQVTVGRGTRPTDRRMLLML